MLNNCIGSLCRGALYLQAQEKEKREFEMEEESTLEEVYLISLS